MIYDFKAVQNELLTGDYAEEWELWTFGGDYVAHVGLDWSRTSWEVIGTCWGGVPKGLIGLFANKASMEFAIRRHVHDPHLVHQEF